MIPSGPLTILFNMMIVVYLFALGLFHLMIFKVNRSLKYEDRISSLSLLETRGLERTESTLRRCLSWKSSVFGDLISHDFIFLCCRSVVCRSFLVQAAREVIDAPACNC